MRKRSRQAGDLTFDPESGQWRELGIKPPRHFRMEEIRRRALRDGFHTGFIQGWGLCSVFFMIVGVIYFGT